MGRKQEEYKGFVAEAVSFQLKDKTGFTVAFGISSDGKGETDETYAPGGAVYPTDEEALEAGLRLARKRIDSSAGDRL
jgi:hypothetical protein